MTTTAPAALGAMTDVSTRFKRSLLKFSRKQSTPPVERPEYADEFDEAARMLDEIVAAERAPKSDDLPARWLADEEVYRHGSVRFLGRAPHRASGRPTGSH
jgi:hypothetical protein